MHPLHISFEQMNMKCSTIFNLSLLMLIDFILLFGEKFLVNIHIEIDSQTLNTNNLIFSINMSNSIFQIMN